MAVLAHSPLPECREPPPGDVFPSARGRRLALVPDGLEAAATVAERLAELAAPAPAPRSLDELAGDRFGALAAGRATSCLICGAAVRPRVAAIGVAAPIAGARCGGCGASYEL